MPRKEKMPFLSSWMVLSLGRNCSYFSDCFLNWQLLLRPGFRESAFQPFKREENSDSSNSEDNEKLKTKEEGEDGRRCTEEEDSEGDEMVDIERIEDKEEDTGNTLPLVSRN